MLHSKPWFPDSVHLMHTPSSMFMLEPKKYRNVRIINHPILLLILTTDEPEFWPSKLLVYDLGMIHCLQLKQSYCDLSIILTYEIDHLELL